MEPTRSTRTSRDGVIDPATRLGHLELTVAELDREVAFYRDVLGFRVQGEAGGTVSLGAGERDLLRLTERRGASRVPGTTGLSHFAILIPRRVDLAQLFQRIIATGAPIRGLEDHHTHEAIYLTDPEGNGLELARDYPRDQWPTFEAILQRGSAPLDVDGLVAELPNGEEPWAGLPADASIGHVFLHVADLVAADAFYHGVLGFDVVGVVPGDAEFVSAGGYHHHVAFNLGAGQGAPPPPSGTPGLDHATIVAPNAVELARVLRRLRDAGRAVEDTSDGYLTRDPSGNGVLLTTEA